MYIIMYFNIIKATYNKTKCPKKTDRWLTGSGKGAHHH